MIRPLSPVMLSTMLTTTVGFSVSMSTLSEPAPPRLRAASV